MTFIDPSLVSTFATDMGANVSDGVGSLWTILLVVGAIPLAFLILNKIVSLVKHGVK